MNIDILGMDPDLYWDLRSGIPFPDGSASAVFLEHVLRALHARPTTSTCSSSAGACSRPGGIVRIGVPDFGRYLESYAGDGAFIDELRPGRPTRLLAVGEVALGHGHRSVWDGETLEAVLTEAASPTRGGATGATPTSTRRRTARSAGPSRSTPRRVVPERS